MNQTIKQSTLQQEFAFTVGNITGEGVTLVDKEYNVIQLPKSLLPIGSVSGSVIRMTLRRDLEIEKKEESQINALIEKLHAGEHVGDTIIGIEDDLNSSVGSSIAEKNDTKVFKKPQVKQSVRVAEEIRASQKPESGMKKKPKVQQVQQVKEQKQSTTNQSIEPSQHVEKPVQRQKSASRRTSSAMKKVKPQSTS